MKKIMLSAAALLIGAAMFAQVPGAPVADQNLVPQNSADAEANAGLSIQNGNDNKVRVRQAGELNTSYTEQDNGSGVGGNLARVRQTGAVNGNVGDSGEDNAAEVRQSGSANQSTTRQEGDRNNAYTAQGQNNDASTGNKARIQQGIANQAEDNFAAIVQDGDNNQANTLQIVDNSDAWTRQIGDDNKSMITQDGAPEDTDGHLANNYQEGTGNENAIMQDGAGARNTALSTQYGDNNQAKQTQTTDALEGGIGNKAVNYQGFTGAGAVQLADIVTADAIFSDINNNVDDTFSGSSTTGSVTNESFGGIVFQDQAGSDNEAYSVQYGSSVDGSNYIKQTQSGSGNDALAIQNRGGGPGGGDNEAEQFQAGDDNELGISQNGTGHKALQTQDGNRNKALSSQLDSGNLLNIHQRGDDNWATSAQRGDANAALLVQRDGQSFIAQQNLDGLGGGGNQIDALQLGPDGDFGTDGIDCGFNEQMDPTMDYTIDPFDLGDVCPGC